MKRLLISILASLATLSFALPALGNEIVKASSFSTHNMVEISPFNLVSGSYQGLFKDQGIPSSGLFLTAIRSGKITAEDLVESAIAKGRLSAITLDDRGYINHVESLMDELDKN